MDADQAKKIAITTSQKQAKKDRAALERQNKQDNAKAKRIATSETVAIIKRIEKAAKKGERIIHEQYAYDNVGRQICYQLHEYFTKLKYTCVIDRCEANYGDSAAPCNVEYWRIAISW